LLALFAVGAGAYASYAPPSQGQMAVVFAPWVSESEALHVVIAAGGRIVGPSRFDNIVIAFALDPGFGERIRASGAWMTLAAQGLCSAEPRKRQAI
jgi:hypothetical protein